ncbi:DUF3857 domain-containing protein [Flavobacterium restrictum]|uniref:DUF3857 domain-containing protein n=1 Tax=Flavobacterium restrictum TaxID=2594428 RepID=A0A553EBE1_9FLAO|nr:DUF3857 domain-containing protein [Flavobacterium restrictum]TRX42275.1 DUF3857 domain-containing protein [Flavobacterium restrictum]
MKIKSLFLVLTICISIAVQAQKSEYNAQSISDSLKENANAVVRLNQIDILIASQRSMTIKTKRVITVLNEKGLRAIDAIEWYNKSTTVRSIEAIVYDGLGNEIKKIKRKDFKDQSAVSGSTLFSENRYVFLDYTPIVYPFTLIYESEVQTSTTAFIPEWKPLTDYFLSVEKSILNVNCPSNLGFKKKEANFSDFKIVKSTDTPTQLSYTATHILAQKREEYSPDFDVIFPVVTMGLEYFNLEGVDGNAKTWKEYGQWFSEKILSGTDDLSAETKTKIRTLVGNETDPIKKARIVYHYVQEKTRYIFIHVGIGGWKPMPASDVDRLGYGDCKALSNYTKALLEAVDVPAYYTELYGDEDKMDIKSDFVSIQGNHVILCVPNKDKYLFLECTSQDIPFGYQANFTDDRNVIVMKPDGGEIIRTKIYDDTDNTKSSKGSYTVAPDGTLSGTVTMVSEGTRYGRKYYLEKMQPTDQEKHYKEYWDNINNLKIDKLAFVNDKEAIRFTENVAISAVNYGTIANNKMMVPVNAFTQYTGSVKRIRNRKTPFEIARGSADSDEIKVVLPAGFSVEFLPANFESKTKFGSYTTEIIKKDDNNLIYKRTLFVKSGLYANKDYDEYRLFMEQVNRNDNAKIILTKN